MVALQIYEKCPRDTKVNKATDLAYQRPAIEIAIR